MYMFSFFLAMAMERKYYDSVVHLLNTYDLSQISPKGQWLFIYWLTAMTRLFGQLKNVSLKSIAISILYVANSLKHMKTKL